MAGDLRKPPTRHLQSIACRPVRITRVPSELAAKPSAQDGGTWGIDCLACAQQSREFGLGAVHVHWSDALRLADWHNRVVHGIDCLRGEEAPLA